MSSCKCASYTDIETGEVLRKRSFDSKKMLRELELIATHEGGEYQLHRCPECGQLWQRSLNWMQGNRQYVFKVPQIGVEDWLEKPFVSPDELLSRFWHLNQYLKSAKFEEQERVCRAPDCPEHAIKLSVLCALHHIQNLGYKTDAPDDYRWFGPFVKSKLDLKMEDLKGLPNYRKLPD